MRRYFSWLALLVFFTVFIPLALRVQATAQQQVGESTPTALGEPTYISLAGAEEIHDTPEPEADEPTQESGLFLNNLDHLLYIPNIQKIVLGAEAQAVVDLVNSERLKAGCPALNVSHQLSAAAQGHSQDMALDDYFSHTSKNGRSPWDRIRATGYEYRSAGENIAADYPTAASAVNAWMDSPGHRANILNCGFEETGVGYYYLANDTGSVNYRHYWTQVFASPR
jgi:uncharacterized protein YkwD